MILTRIETTKVVFWSIVFPVLVAIVFGITMGAPYSSLSGMVTLLFVGQMYRDLDYQKYEAFKFYALFVFLIFAMALAGWADR
jgi:hypothetical protein